MEKESNFLLKAKSNKWAWIIIAIVVLCAALVFLIIVAGVFFLRPFWSYKTAAPGPQIVPTVQTGPVVPSVPTESPFADTLPILDYEADALFGSVSLQRGFSPDPHIVAAVAGGTVDTLDLNLDCGFTSSFPTFAFSLSGGASEGFLRIFYVTSDGTDTTLVVHTPNQEWLCMDNSSYGSRMDPVVDIELAASGKYAIWVGTQQSDTYGTGSLFITQSADTTP